MWVEIIEIVRFLWLKYLAGLEIEDGGGTGQRCERLDSGKADILMLEKVVVNLRPVS
jgi:hypothetical protein